MFMPLSDPSSVPAASTASEPIRQSHAPSQNRQSSLPDQPCEQLRDDGCLHQPLVEVRRQMLSHDRATLQLVAHELKPKLLTILNFGNGYQSAAVNRCGENGVRENANGGDGGWAS